MKDPDPDPDPGDPKSPDPTGSGSGSATLVYSIPQRSRFTGLYKQKYFNYFNSLYQNIALNAVYFLKNIFWPANCCTLVACKEACIFRHKHNSSQQTITGL